MAALRRNTRPELAEGVRSASILSGTPALMTEAASLPPTGMGWKADANLRSLISHPIPCCLGAIDSHKSIILLARMFEFECHLDL